MVGQGPIFQTESRFRLDIRSTFSMMREPKEVVDVFFLNVFKVRTEVALNSLI